MTQLTNESTDSTRRLPVGLYLDDLIPGKIFGITNNRRLWGSKNLAYTPDELKFFFLESITKDMKLVLNLAGIKQMYFLKDTTFKEIG